MLGIIGAMDEEVAMLKAELDNVTVNTYATMDFYTGSYKGKDVVIVRSGIGKVNAGICAQILCDRFNVSAIINTGIAGSLKNEINIGDIVLSKDTVEHDMDATGFGYEHGIIPRMETSYFNGDPKLIELASKACESVCSHVQYFVDRVVTGDQFISDKSKKNWLSEKFNGACCEMEGGAIAHAAYLNKVPFLIIRSISDKADDSAHMDYPAFEAMAIENSVRLMKEIILNYN